MAKENKKKEQYVNDESEKMEKVMAFILMKRLIIPIKKTKAYKLKLVDKEGKIIKQPETNEEKKALTTFDKVVFKLKKLLGSKIAQLNTFMYLQNSEEDFSDNIIVLGGIEKRGMVKRVHDDMKRMLEGYGVLEDEFFNTILFEELRKKECNL